MSEHGIRAAIAIEKARAAPCPACHRSSKTIADGPTTLKDGRKVGDGMWFCTMCNAWGVWLHGERVVEGGVV